MNDVVVHFKNSLESEYDSREQLPGESPEILGFYLAVAKLYLKSKVDSDRSYGHLGDRHKQNIAKEEFSSKRFESDLHSMMKSDEAYKSHNE